MPSSHTLDALVVAFDDDHAVANAGLALTATLAERLGVETVADELVDLGDRPGHHRPGRKALTCWPRWWPAATRSTTPRCSGRAHRAGARASGDGSLDLGTFLRSCTFGHIRQLDQVAETLWPEPGLPVPAQAPRS